MDGGDQNLGNGGSRWNPTKEQINMLEGLYKQGLRTPSAEQIQQITARLKDFGHIEGKNVFYWFQNHKARQRQKQKQETFAYYNRFLHTTPVFPPYPNVVCGPCYVPQQKNDAKLIYQHYPKVQLPNAGGSIKRSRLTAESADQSQRYNTKSTGFNFSKSTHHQETLDLFPIHPTGILQSRNGIDDEREIKNPNSRDENQGKDDGHPYFDFFCGN
ncbi:hypothetical protein ACS0TY_000599 [Phlomoides rotata]